MTAGLDAPRFTKIRALHDRTDIVAEKAAAANCNVGPHDIVYRRWDR